ncbi:hypothetical protein BKA82DRAFT_4118906 [Pisolithus tinctorius]|nr:hypothetical protein BKA82DRAFT_4118906 [Pisolithus tinctorius]
MSTFQLTNNAVKLGDIPPESTIITLGNELLASTESWKKGKTFANGKVLTLRRLPAQGSESSCHCRVSRHDKDDATFDEFWSKLGVNKAENEKQFVGAIKQVAEVKRISATQSIWTLYYTYPPPVSPRVFTVLQTTYLSSASPRSGLIVSIPIDVSEDEELAKIERKGVRGRYVAVERLLELDDDKVEWRMATSATPGGMIPSFIAESSMPGQIAADVTHFLKWFRTIRNRTAVEA